MGQVANLCSGDIFKELQEKYGNTFTKLMVAEKSKEVVNEEFGKLNSQSNETFQGFNNKTVGIIDEKTKALTNIFDDLKSKVSSTLPGGIPALEKVKGQSINEFSGFNSIQNQITSVKVQAFSKIETEKANVMGELKSKKQGMISQIEQEKPKIAMYDELPDPLRTVVRHQAEETFADQFSKNKGAIVQSIGKQFNVGNLDSIFQKISPEASLNGILNGATGQLTSALGLGNIGGGIGNLIGGGGSNGFPSIGGLFK